MTYTLTLDGLISRFGMTKHLPLRFVGMGLAYKQVSAIQLELQVLTL